VIDYFVILLCIDLLPKIKRIPVSSFSWSKITRKKVVVGL